MPDFSQAEDILFGKIKGLLDKVDNKLPIYWPGKDASVDPDANQPYVLVINTPATNKPETLGRQAIWKTEGILLVRFIFSESANEYSRWNDVALSLLRCFQQKATGSGVYTTDVRRGVAQVLTGRYAIDVMISYYFRDNTNIRRT